MLVHWLYANRLIELVVRQRELFEYVHGGAERHIYKTDLHLSDLRVAALSCDGDGIANGRVEIVLRYVLVEAGLLEQVSYGRLCGRKVHDYAFLLQFGEYLQRLIN